MAKFVYRMQNILDIKYKLEDSARQEYADKRIELNIEEEKLEKLKERKRNYYLEYNEAITGKLDFLNIESLANAMDLMDEYIFNQSEVIKKKSKELEKARQKLNTLMQERKMHEKLKEKNFEAFKEEINAAESKEIDEVVSYKFNTKEIEE